MDEETRCSIAFSAFPGIGPVRFSVLYSYFGSACAAWKADAAQLRAILPERLLSVFLDFRKRFDISAYIAKLEQLNISVICVTQSSYPVRLKQLADPPLLLYIKGDTSVLHAPCMIAVVGTRTPTAYGVHVTRTLTGELVAHGFTIVSGLAYGIDAVAHKTALEYNGKTIAVLGCGIDIVAPSGNARLYRDIIAGGGAIVSEMPLGLRPDKGLFVARNRIISGLSQGVVVTEGAAQSGTLITARMAAEQGREVFAVPGPVTSRYSQGPARLLKSGATLVESINDILANL